MSDFSAADRLMSEAARDGLFTAGVLLAGRGDEILHQRAFGRLSPEEDAPPCTPGTRFDLASLTKPLVTAMLVFRAAEQGRLCLWDTLALLGDVPEDKAGLTLEQILSHQAGFRPGIHMWQEAASPEEGIRLLLETPLMYAPGTRVQYCCAGYILLGKLLEKVYGLPLAEAARREVFAPLGMSRTGFLPEGGNIAATERQPDGRCLTGIVHDENARFLGGAAGNAGVFSTAGDLSLFARMLAAEGRLPDGRRYLSPASVRALFTCRTEGLNEHRTPGFRQPARDMGYCGDLFPAGSVGHTGFTGTCLTLDPASGLYLILLTNRVCPTRGGDGIHRFRRLVHNAVAAGAGAE